MAFSFFGPKKANLWANLLNQHLIGKKVLENLARIKSLRTLGRQTESEALLVTTEKMASDYLRDHAGDKWAHVLLAHFYSEIDTHEKAVAILKLLLESPDLGVTQEERDVFEGTLQKIRRERPISERSADIARGFTHVYCCQHCGRFINYVSLPCAHCQWSPQSKEELARSMVLSNQYFEVPQLMVLCREMAKGRPANDVVPNLVEKSEKHLRDPLASAAIERTFKVLRESESRSSRDMNVIRECANCGSAIWFSALTNCAKCKEPIQLPDAARFMVCIDLVLQYFETKVDPKASREFSELVCVAVKMLDDLLRKQQAPSKADREYAMSLLKDIQFILCGNAGGAIDTSNPKQLEVHLFKDRMTEESEMATKMLSYEIKLFVDRMVEGVKM